MREHAPIIQVSRFTLQPVPTRPLSPQPLNKNHPSSARDERLNFRGTTLIGARLTRHVSRITFHEAPTYLRFIGRSRLRLVAFAFTQRLHGEFGHTLVPCRACTTSLLAVWRDGPTTPLPCLPYAVVPPIIRTRAGSVNQPLVVYRPHRTALHPSCPVPCCRSRSGQSRTLWNREPARLWGL
jgi:hypothetical protein